MEQPGEPGVWLASMLSRRAAKRLIGRLISKTQTVRIDSRLLTVKLR